MNNSLRSHAFAFSIALLVVASGALMANAKLSSEHADTAAISRFAIGAKTTLEKASSGFVDTFGDIPSRIASRVSAAETAMRKYPPHAAVLSSASARATPLELSLPRITFDTDSHAFRTDSIYALEQSPDKKTVTVSGTGQTHTLSLRRIGETAYALISSPETIIRASAGAYAAVGEQAYAAIETLLAAYRTLIDYSGSRALTLGAGARDALAAAPLAAMRADIAFGEFVINTAHALIRADVSAAYGIAAAAPAVARATALGIGRTGAALASAASRVPSLAVAFYLEAAALPSRAAPVLAEAIFSVEYAGASRFVALTDKILEQYGSFILDTGSLAHVSAANASALARSAYALLAVAPATLEDAYLGALGKGALALEAPETAAVLSAAQPVLALGEKAALATYETIRGLFDSTNRLFAVILGPSPTIVLPVAKKTDRTALGNVPPPPPPPVPSSARTLVTNYPTYTTVIQGVSPEAVDRSLVDLRADILTTVAGMIQPVRTQTITNATTIQQVNMIQDLSDLIVRNGDFRGGIFDNGIRVSATSGTFSSLGGGTTTLATTTITGSISIPATGLSLGSLDGPLQSNAGAVSATTSIGVLYGGTGLSSAPAYGQVLLGNASGGYTLSATSSLGITGGGAWGTVTGTLSNQTDLQSALDAKLSLSSWFATTTAPHITTLENLINATTTNLHITSAITGAGLTSCSGSSSKLLWNATTRQFSCGADAGAGGGITAFGAQFSSFQTGSSQTFATSSDTNIGLTITSGTDTHTFTPTWTGTLAVGRGGTGVSSFTSSQLLYGAGTGALQSVATSSLSLGLGLTNSGTLGSLVGGTSATLSIATSSLYSGTTGQFPYFSGTNALTATSTLFLSADGKLSIGTTTPLDFFHIAPPAAQGLLLTDAVTLTSSMRLIPSDGVNYIQSGTTTATDSKADLRFTSIFNETTWMTIQGATGNVGIGTTSPASFSFPTASPALDISSAPGAGVAGIVMHDRDTAQESALGTNGSLFTMSVSGHATAANNVLSFATEETDSAYTPSERMRITSAGLIGIGTTSPYRTLSVSGSAVFSGGDILASTLTATSSITAASLSLTTALPVSSGGTGWAAIQSGAIPYGNGSSALATTTAGTAGNVLALLNGIPTWTATTTFSSGLLYAGGNVTNTGVLSLAHSAGSAQTGALTLATSTTAIANDWGITNSGGTFTFNLPTASASVRGLLSNTDWSTFNSKQATISATYPITLSGATVGLAFGTTTSNTWAGTQTFNITTATATATAQTLSLGSNAFTADPGIGSLPGTLSLNEATNNAYGIGLGGARNGLFDMYFQTGAANGGGYRWYVGTSEKMTMNSTGNLGIGTTTPRYLLQLASSTAPQLALSDGSLTSDHWTFRNAGGALYLATSSPLTFATSSTPRIVIGTNGNIGIGTTTPDQPLLIDTHIGITSGESRSVRSALTYNPPSVSSAIPVAIAGEASYEGVGGGSGGAHMIGVTGIASMTASGQTFPKFIGVRARADVVSGTLTEGNAVLAGSGRNSGTITTLYGVKTDVTGNTGAITDYYGFHSQGTDNSGTITSYTGLSVTMPNGTVSTTTGIKIADLTGTGAYNRGIVSSVLTGTNKHNLYIDGTAPSYFAADIGIGTTSPDTFTYPTASPLLNISSPAGTGITVLAMHDRDTTQESAFGTAGNGFVMSVAGHATASNNYIAFQTEDTASVYTPTERMRITSAGLIGLGTTSPATLLEVGGSTNNITFDGYKNCTGYTSNGNGLLACTASDERLKQNIVSLGAPQGLSAINALNPVSFYWKPSADRGEQQQYGLIAQQVRDIFPNLVQATNPTSLTPDGTLSVNYEGLISPMILAIQELHATTTIRLTSLEDRIAALESGAISSTSGSSVLSTTSLASALESFGVLIQKGIAEFNTLVFRELVASTDADGASSAGSVSIIAGNTVAQVANPLVRPSTKIFITFNTRIAGSWWVSDKQAGGFRVSLSEAQAGDVSFDYFLVQTEGQLSAPESNVGTSYVPISGTDTVAPVLTLLGDNPLRLPVGAPFTDPGITAVDAVDGVISSIGIFVDGIAQESPSAIVDTGSAATHIITYSASDRIGNSATITRSVIVGESQAPSVSEVQAPADATPPVVTLVGDAAIEVATFAAFTDPGATALDETDGDITPSIVVSGAVDTAAAGLYTLTYTATDAAGNTASVSRVVTVVEAVPAS